MAVSPQCLTLSAWPTAMSFRLFAALIKRCLYLVHPSFHFLCSCTLFLVYFKLLGDIFNLPMTNQTQIAVKLPVLGHVIDQPLQDFSSVSLHAFLFRCFPAASPLTPTHTVPPVFPLEGVSLLSDSGAS